MNSEQFMIEEYSKKIVECYKEMKIQETSLNGCGGF